MQSRADLKRGFMDVMAKNVVREVSRSGRHASGIGKAGLLALLLAASAAGGCATRDLTADNCFTYKNLPQGQIDWHESKARWADVWHGPLN